MFERIIMNRTPGRLGWEVIADGVDITDFVMGWQIGHADPAAPNGPPVIWLAFLPDHIIMDSKWRDEEAHP